MQNPSSRLTDRLRRPAYRRGAAATAALAVLSMTAAACGGGGSTASSTGGATASSSGAAPPAAAGSGSSSGSSGTSSAALGGSPSITAHNVSLPSGTPGKGKPTIVLGTKNFAEEFLLGDLYQTALAAKGFSVTQKPNIGGSEVIDTSFKSGQINLYPEYLGEIVTSVAKKPPQKTDVASYDVAKKFENTQRNATLLKQTPFQDVDVLFTKAAFAKKYHLKSIADLKNVGPKGQGVIYVDQPPGRTRIAGLKGLQQVYGLTNVKFLGAQAGQQYKAIDEGHGNVGDAFSTDPSFASGIKSGKYVQLSDPKAIMGFEHVAPVVKKKLLAQEGPAFKQTLNWVDSLLTLKAVQAMDTAVQSNHQDAHAVAKKFLDANGL